jgi:hypothetical protein
MPAQPPVLQRQPAAAPVPEDMPAQPPADLDDPQAAARSFLAVDPALIEDVLSDILRAAARRHGVEV